MRPDGLRIGIDIGGTFTDFTLLDSRTGTLHHYKVPSTPQSPADALINGVRQLTDQVRADPREISYFVHGTTLALNTIIQRRGARVALIVSRGTRSMLDIARLRVPQQFSFTPTVPEPLVPATRVYEIGGRLSPSGEELEPLPVDELEQALRWLRAQKVEACAVCLLHAYANPRHERLVKSAIQEALPGVRVSASSEIWPEIREYERAMIAVMNAYIAPQMERYLARLEQQAATIGLQARLYITKSNGGIMSARSAIEVPVETLLSGPASGVVGAAFVARPAGASNCVTLDMGGTSADVALVMEGEPLYSTENQVGDFPVVMPSVDVSSIGAGGSSIAWIDRYGVLKVGPGSAGADPGPACYGLGGTAPTVTDAYLVCGFLDPGYFLGGRMRLDPGLARTALQPLAKGLGLSVELAAESVLRVATANMVTQFMPLMTKKGVDPRRYPLLAYGGAGPTHACLLAAEVGIRQVIIPPSPGTLCATGALINNVKKDYVQTFRRSLQTLDLEEARRCVQSMEEEAVRWLDAESLALEGREVIYAADMRYKGQAYEIEVPLDSAALERPEILRRRFDERHQLVYHHSDPEAPAEIVNLRLRIVGLTPKPQVTSMGRGLSAERPSASHYRPMLVKGRWVDAAVYERASLRPGALLQGPCIVEQEDTTTLVLPGFRAHVDTYGNIILEQE